MFVKIECFVENRVGCDNTFVVEFPDDTTDDELETYADECAMDNAESYGAFDDGEESGVEDEAPYSSRYEILDMSRAEIEEEYGEITLP